MATNANLLLAQTPEGKKTLIPEDQRRSFERKGYKVYDVAEVMYDSGKKIRYKAQKPKIEKKPSDVIYRKATPEKVVEVTKKGIVKVTYPKKPEAYKVIARKNGQLVKEVVASTLEEAQQIQGKLHGEGYGVSIAPTTIKKLAKEGWEGQTTREGVYLEKERNFRPEQNLRIDKKTEFKLDVKRPEYTSLIKGKPKAPTELRNVRWVKPEETKQLMEKEPIYKIYMGKALTQEQYHALVKQLPSSTEVIGKELEGIGDIYILVKSKEPLPEKLSIPTLKEVMRQRKREEAKEVWEKASKLEKAGLVIGTVFSSKGTEFIGRTIAEKIKLKQPKTGKDVLYEYIEGAGHDKDFVSKQAMGSIIGSPTGQLGVGMLTGGIGSELAMSTRYGAEIVKDVGVLSTIGMTLEAKKAYESGDYGALTTMGVGALTFLTGAGISSKYISKAKLSEVQKQVDKSLIVEKAKYSRSVLRPDEKTGAFTTKYEIKSLPSNEKFQIIGKGKVKGGYKLLTKDISFQYGGAEVKGNVKFKIGSKQYKAPFNEFTEFVGTSKLEPAARVGNVIVKSSPEKGAYVIKSETVPFKREVVIRAIGEEHLPTLEGKRIFAKEVVTPLEKVRSISIMKKVGEDIPFDNFNVETYKFASISEGKSLSTGTMTHLRIKPQEIPKSFKKQASGEEAFKAFWKWATKTESSSVGGIAYAQEVKPVVAGSAPPKISESIVKPAAVKAIGKVKTPTATKEAGFSLTTIMKLTQPSVEKPSLRAATITKIKPVQKEEIKPAKVETIIKPTATEKATQTMIFSQSEKLKQGLYRKSEISQRIGITTRLAQLQKLSRSQKERLRTGILEKLASEQILNMRLEKPISSEFTRFKPRLSPPRVLIKKQGKGESNVKKLRKSLSLPKIKIKRKKKEKYLPDIFSASVSKFLFGKATPPKRITPKMKRHYYAGLPTQELLKKKVRARSPLSLKRLFKR